MVEPTSIREVNIVSAEFRNSVDQQFANLNSNLSQRFGSVEGRLKGLSARTYWVVAALVAFLLSSGLLYKELGQVQKGVEFLQIQATEIKKDTAEVKEKLAKIDVARIDANFGRLETAVSNLNGTLAKLDGLSDLANSLSRLTNTQALWLDRTGRTPFEPITLDVDEMSLVRKFIPVKKGDVNVKLGQAAPDTVSLEPTPANLSALVPKLKGTRFFVGDGASFAAFVRVQDNLIVAIVAG